MYFWNYKKKIDTQIRVISRLNKTISFYHCCEHMKWIETHEKQSNRVSKNIYIILQHILPILFVLYQ